MTEQQSQSDVMVIRSYFFADAPAAVVMKEIKELSAEERKQLADGIRNGTFTY